MLRATWFRGNIVRAKTLGWWPKLPCRAAKPRYATLLHREQTERQQSKPNLTSPQYENVIGGEFKSFAIDVAVFMERDASGV
jgi:hypothetical protein